MSEAETPGELCLRPRPSETVTLSVPLDALEKIRERAAARDMSPEALLKLYIGQGLRQDASQLFSENVLETMAEVLARHIPSEEERSASSARSGARLPPDASSART